MAETKVLYCKCKHDYQDKVYGKNKRVHNPSSKNDGEYRCTVCANIRKDK